jgi:hypothetical protein
MLSKLRPRSIYDVLAALAFFAVVAGGSAYAAATIGSSQIKKNAVLSKHIENGQVKTGDLAANAVTSGKIKDGQVMNGDLSGNSVDGGKIVDGSIGTADLGPNSVTEGNVTDFSLRLHDLGGETNDGTSAAGFNATVPPSGCRLFTVKVFDPGAVPPGVIGSLVVGYLTDAQGHAVLNNGGVVVPTVVSETSQGGALANLMVCADSSQSVPAASVFHYRIIGP